MRNLDISIKKTDIYNTQKERNLLLGVWQKSSVLKVKFIKLTKFLDL